MLDSNISHETTMSDSYILRFENRDRYERKPCVFLEIQSMR